MAILNPGDFSWTDLVKDYMTMLHTTFEASEQIVLKKKTFEYFSIYFYASKPGPLA